MIIPALIEPRWLYYATYKSGGASSSNRRSVSRAPPAFYYINAVNSNYGGRSFLRCARALLALYKLYVYIYAGGDTMGRNFEAIAAGDFFTFSSL